MMKAVPVVSVSMLIRRKAQPGWVTTSPTAPLSERSPLLSASSDRAMPKLWTIDRAIVP